MFGSITIPRDNLDTDVRVELLDITDGPNRPEQVLSVSPVWRRPESPVFFYQPCNGTIPCKKTVLAKPITVAKIPLHLLRFARRGRRKIQVYIRIVRRDDGQIIAHADEWIEYVTCSEGFIELQERHEAVLQASIELACAVATDEPFSPQIAEIIGDWLAEKTRRFTPRSNLSEPLTRLETSGNSIDTAAACECLLAWGQKTDIVAAMDLALQIAAIYPEPSDRLEAKLWAMADGLELRQEQFEVLCQKRLLTENCSLQRWRLLLGIRHEPSPEQLQRRLNEEYRKWNARVTHTDARIRRQADIVLSLIAEIRSRHLVHTP